ATDLGPPDLGPVARGVRHATVVSRGKDAPGGVRTDPRGVVCGPDAGGVPGGRCAMSRFQAKFPSDRMAGRVALVTGGARGMGASTVRRLVAEGAQVVITDVLDAEGEALAAELGENAVYAHLDVTDEAGWAKVAELAKEKFGPVTALVNNAGIVLQAPTLETTADDFRKVLDVNVTGVFLGTKARVPQMIEAGGGAVVNISSAAGIVGMPNLSAYCASKWGVRGMTKAMALDLGHQGVRVNSIHPGAIRTPMAAGIEDEHMGHQAIPRVGEPEEIAAAVAFLVSDDAQDITGAELAVDGGMVLGSVAMAVQEAADNEVSRARGAGRAGARFSCPPASRVPCPGRPDSSVGRASPW